MNTIDFSNSIKCEDKIKLITDYFDQIMALYGIVYQYQYNELSIDSLDADYISFKINLNNEMDTLRIINVINLTGTLHIYNNSYNIYCSHIDNTSLLVGLMKRDIPC